LTTPAIDARGLVGPNRAIHTCEIDLAGFEMVIHLALGVSNQPDIAQHWAIDDALRFESLNELRS